MVVYMDPLGYKSLHGRRQFLDRRSYLSKLVCDGASLRI